MVERNQSKMACLDFEEVGSIPNEHYDTRDSFIYNENKSDNAIEEDKYTYKCTDEYKVGNGLNAQGITGASASASEAKIIDLDDSVSVNKKNENENENENKAQTAEQSDGICNNTTVNCLKANDGDTFASGENKNKIEIEIENESGVTGSGSASNTTNANTHATLAHTQPHTQPQPRPQIRTQIRTLGNVDMLGDVDVLSDEELLNTLKAYEKAGVEVPHLNKVVKKELLSRAHVGVGITLPSFFME